MFTAIISVVCLAIRQYVVLVLASNSQYAPVQALLWTGGAICLHALAIKFYLTRYLHISFIYTTGESPRNTLILKRVIMTR